MAMSEIERIGIVGGGLMGSGIAEVCAFAGRDVLLREIDGPMVDAAKRRIEVSMKRAAKARELSDSEIAEVQARIGYTTDLKDMADRQFVVEAVVESEAEKLAVFSDLDKVVVDDSAILASNTSSIPIMKLAMATSRPGQVIGVHFFNPVPRMGLVELVTSLLTNEDTEARCAGFAEEVLGKRVIRSQDRAGFIVNALLIPYLLSAIRMQESGFATADDIDTGMVEGCHHPMGPLALTDLIGLDTTLAVAQSLYEEFKEPLYAPPPLLSRMVEAGLLGRKSGRGFYTYEAR